GIRALSTAHQFHINFIAVELSHFSTAHSKRYVPLRRMERRSVVRLLALAELLALDGLEQRAEVAAAEARIAGALDDLVEERARLGVVVGLARVAEEDLQHVLVVAAVEQDAEAAELGDGLFDVGDLQLLEARGQHVVVRARRVEEADA